MVRGSLVLLALLLLAPDAQAATRRKPSSPATPPPPSTTKANPTSPLLEGLAAFGEARMAAGRGDTTDALAGLAEAIRLVPDEPYLRLEQARLLLRLAAAGRNAGDRQRRQDTALESLRTARRLAPANLEVQREAGILLLELGDDHPEALSEAREALEAARTGRPSDPEILYPLGQLYRLGGEPEKAVEALRTLVGVERGTPWVRSALERALLELFDRKGKGTTSAEAVGLLQEVLNLNPGNKEARVTLAEIFGRRGEHAQAVALLDALAPEDISADLRERLTWELFMSGDLGRAAEQAAQLDATVSRPAATLRALVDAAQGHAEEAFAELAPLDAEGGRSKSIEAAGSVARALVASHRQDAARDFLAAALAALAGLKPAPDASSLRLALAENLAAKGAWSEVEKTLHPLSGGALTPPLGASPWSVGEQWRLPYADALVHLDRGGDALRLLPSAVAGQTSVGGMVQLVSKRAEVLLALGRGEEAEAELKALAADGAADSSLQAARVYLRLKRYAEALPWLAQLITRDPSSIEGLYFTGVARERLGELDAAVEAFRQVLGHSPDFAPALNYLGYLWAERGENLEEALKLLERAVEIDPDNGAYLDSLGWTQFQRRELDRARGHLERAAELAPEDATVFEHLGDVYIALGLRDKALTVYRKSLDLTPEDAEQVRRKLQELGDS